MNTKFDRADVPFAVATALGALLDVFTVRKLARLGVSDIAVTRPVNAAAAVVKR
jgi:hypothetical protein